MEFIYQLSNLIGSSNSNNKNNERNEKLHTREQILSIARKAESLGYDSLSVNDHIVFRTSWLDVLSTLSVAGAVTNKIKLGTSIYNITPDKFREKWNMLLSYRKRLGKDSVASNTSNATGEL